MSRTKSPGWLRAVTIGLGVLVIILSIYALAFPALTFVTVVWILCIVLFFVGIEKIITGIFLPQRSKWATIGLGVLVLIFAGLAIAYPEATAFVVIIFIGVALLFNGIARVVEGMSGHHSGWGRASTYRCWNIINNLIDSSNGISCLWCCPCRHYHCHSSVDNWNADGCNRFCWPENEESNQRY